MLRQLLQGTSWIALRAAEDEKGTPPPPLGDAHGDEVLEHDPQAPPTEPETPAASETPPKSETPPTPAPPVTEKPKPDWKDKEMARRARRIDEERTEKERLVAENRRLTDLAETLAKGPPQEPGEQPAPTPAPRQSTGKVYTEQDVQAEARRLAAETQFKRDFDDAYQGGASKFGRGKMDDAIARISELGGLDYDHLQMVLATDEPAKVLYDLGSRPEEFQRIMELPFNRRVAEFVKMGLKTEPRSPSASRAPEPVEPISGGGGAVDNRYQDSASDADWYREEEKRSMAHWKKKQQEYR